MSLNNVGKIVDYIELLAGKAGVNRDSMERELLYEIINSKAKEFASDTGILETFSTINTVANQQEYELPSDKLNVGKVLIDGLKVHKITFNQIEELSGDVS